MLQGFTAREVAGLAGFKTALMLNYLERSKVFQREYHAGPHQGKQRLYSYRDLVILRAINRLLLLGARPKRIEDAMRTFRQIEDLPHDAESLAEFARKSSLFVVTADQVLFCDCDALVELSRGGQLAFSFMVDNHTVLAPVVGAVTEYAKVAEGRRRNRKVLDAVLKRWKVA